jgi:hypothetical protein
MNMLRLVTAHGQQEPIPARPSQLTIVAPEVSGEPADLNQFRLTLVASVVEAALRDQGTLVRRQSSVSAESTDLTIVLDGAERPATSDTALTVAGLLIDGRPPGERQPLPALAEALTRPGGAAALRYFGLTAHYRQQWCFSWNGLIGATCALRALTRQVAELAAANEPTDLSTAGLALRRRFDAALADDLDTPGALGVVWQAARAGLSAGERRRLLLEFDGVLGLGLEAAARAVDAELPAEAQRLIEQRDGARRDRDWARSDELRAALAALGVEAQDSPQGSVYRRAATAAGTFDTGGT